MGFEINDRVKFWSIILNFVLIALVIALLKGCNCAPCYEAGQTVIRHDTIYPKDELKPIVVKVPEAYKAVARKDLKPRAAVRYFLDTAKNHTPDSLIITSDECDSVRYYSDTIRNRTPDTCRIVINDTIIGKITGRSVWYVDLRPSITTTITQVKRDKWKVYIGGAFTYNNRYHDRWGAGPELLLTIPKVGGISYSYDVKNNSHTAGVMALIRFKK